MAGAVIRIARPFSSLLLHHALLIGIAAQGVFQRFDVAIEILLPGELLPRV